MGRTFIGLFAALIWVQAAHASASTPPDVLVPYGDEAAEVAFQPGGLEEMAHGPSALAVSGQRLYIADNLNHRVLVLTRHGEPVRSLSMVAPASDIAVEVGGSLAVLDAARDRLLVMDAAGGIRLDQALEGGSVRHLALGPTGRAWMVLADGHAVAVEGGSGRVHAAPMGPGASWHAAGRKVSDRQGEVLLWSWEREALLKPQGPTRTIPVQTQQELGLIRPMGMDVHGRLYVHLETLGESQELRVRTTILRVDPDGSQHRISWEPSSFAPSIQDLALGDDGTVYRMEATPSGLGVWRYDASRWQEVVR
ncbi:MAG: hypothetical protein VYE15_08030 [Myxococcota bacterium]|nr:hypothetical protein [Myxococcota bacterium]